MHRRSVAGCGRLLSALREAAAIVRLPYREYVRPTYSKLASVACASFVSMAYYGAWTSDLSSRASVAPLTWLVCAGSRRKRYRNGTKCLCISALALSTPPPAPFPATSCAPTSLARRPPTPSSARPPEMNLQARMRQAVRQALAEQRRPGGLLHFDDSPSLGRDPITGKLCVRPLPEAVPMSARKPSSLSRAFARLCRWLRKKRILVSFAWAIALIAVYMVASMLMF